MSNLRCGHLYSVVGKTMALTSGKPAGADHQHEMQCTLQGISAVQPLRPVKTHHTASHLEQQLSLHPKGSDKKVQPRNAAFAASHLEARSTLHPK